MTLTRFVTKNAFRNKRRSILTVLSIAFSLLLLTLMMTIWRGFYSTRAALSRAKAGGAASGFSDVQLCRGTIERKFARFLESWRWCRSHGSEGFTKTRSRRIFSPQFGTDPDEFFKVYRDIQMPQEQITAWQRDRQGVIVDDTLAKKYGWKLGDRILSAGHDLSRESGVVSFAASFTPNPDNKSVYFNTKYVEEAVPTFKGQAGTFTILADTPGDVSKVASGVDDMFRNSPQPTKAESEKAFGLEFVAMMGNVKAFILSICSAVVFATLLVSANTMAMSIRERTREVAVLKTLGFTRRGVLGLFVSEAVSLSLGGGLIGAGLGWLMVYGFTHSPQFFSFFPLGNAWNWLSRSVVRTGGTAQRGGAFVSCFANQHCGRTPPHRMSTQMK